MTPRPPTPIGHYGTIHAKRLETGVWHARTRYRGLDGRSREVTARGRTKTIAINRLKARIEDQRISQSEAFGVESQLEDLLRWWVEHHQGLTDRSRSDYRLIAERHLIPRCGGVRLREVSTALVDRVLEDIQEKRAMVRTINGERRRVQQGGVYAAQHARTILSQALDEAVRWDIITVNPAKGARPIRRARREVDALSLEDLRRLRRLVREHYAGLARRAWSAEWMPDLIDLLVGTGLRIGEALALRWEDVNLTTGTLGVTGTIDKHAGFYGRKDAPKTDSSRRTVALPGWLVSVLRRRKLATSSEWVFTTHRGTLVNITAVGGHLRKILPEDLQHVTPHMIRRSVATLIERESDAAAAALQLGHRDEGVTRRHYIARRTESDARAVLEGIA